MHIIINNVDVCGIAFVMTLPRADHRRAAAAAAHSVPRSVVGTAAAAAALARLDHRNGRAVAAHSVPRTTAAA